MQDLPTSSAGSSTLQALSASSSGALSTRSDELEVDGELNIEVELNVDCDEGVPLVPRGGYRAGGDGRSVPLGTLERVRHRAVNHKIDSK